MTGPGHKPVDHLFSAAYEELRRLASSVHRDDARVTLNPTALVNEAYLKLAGSLRLTPESHLHFKRIAARAMRQVLIEAARRRKADKRGGDAPLVTLDERIDGAVTRSEEVLALDAALDELEQLSPRQARVVECRFFGGLDNDEIARSLEISLATVERDWRSARAWLALRLRKGS